MHELSNEHIKNLKLRANTIRQLIIEAVDGANHNTASGHTGGPLGMADVFAALYFNFLNHDPKNPTDPDRDRLLLSNGHICAVLYASLALSGYFPTNEIKTFRGFETRLQGHPHRGVLPGIENTSGPLGEGLSQAIGIALARDLDKKDYTVFVATSDGEHQEGNIWEAAMLAGKLKLNNLIQIIDFNNIQIDGPVEEVMPLEPFRAKYESFNWHVIEIDGNNMDEICEAIKTAKSVNNKPVIIVARTIPGKGISYMEGNYKWHGMPPGLKDVDGAPPKEDQVKVAIDELKAEREKIINEE